MSRSTANFLHALAAVVGGNALYFLLEKYLPAPARHTLFKVDFGAVVDFGICLIFFVVIKGLAGRDDDARPDRR